MRGIVGYVGSKSRGVVDLRATLSTLRHRGPDGTGTHKEIEVGLGMFRLAIIDVAGCRQPMANEDGSLWIVFNGEVYNHRELRLGLETKGHRFRSRCDTEVILHCWFRDGLFLFASELKALLCHPAISRELDWEAFHHYLAFGYTPADRSIFAHIAKLPPAHTATLREGILNLRWYWTLVGTRLPLSAQEAAAMRLRRRACLLRRQHSAQQALGGIHRAISSCPTSGARG